MRKKALARQAERIAAARAKSATVGTGASTPSTQEAASEQNKPTASSTSAGSPLHPSLPAKPGSASPPKVSEPSQTQSTPTPTPPTPTPTQAERVPTPTPTLTPTSAAPVTTPPDEQILKLEEVTSFHFQPRKGRVI